MSRQWFSNFVVAATCASVNCGWAADTSNTGSGLLRNDLFQVERNRSTLSLSNYTLAVRDDFSTCDSIDDERFDRSNQGFRWFADSGGMGGRNLGDFVSVGTARQKGWPASIDCALGHLRLTLSKGEDGRWHGAQIKTHSYGGHGYLQRYGYWEMDAMLPPLPDGFVPWAAMWVVDRLATTPIPQTFEFDVLETGMHALTERTFQTTVHRWPAKPALPSNLAANAISAHESAETTVNFNMFDGKRHRYGLLRTRDWHVVYVDGIERTRYPTLTDDMRTPVKLLIDLAIMVPPARGAIDSYSMHVYEVRMYKAPE